MVLLSDGSVMVHGGGGQASSTFYRLQSDSTGSFSNGTWSTLGSMSLERLFATSVVLPSGKVMTMGGEYTGPNTSETFNNTGEIYDPIANSWSNIANFPQTMFGDDPLEVLPDGRVLAGYLAGPQTYIYDPAANTWTQTGTKLRNDQSDEETWIKLPDDSILSYDVFSSITDNVGHAQRYIPASGTWVDAGTPPLPLSSDALGAELGPGFLLPDGRALYFGANGNTVYYTPSTNTWTAGNPIPLGLGMADAPGAMMPNGHILISVSPTNPLFSPPASIYEFDPVAGTYTNVTPPGFNPNNSSFNTQMLVLPSGQVMLVDDSRQIGIYTPNGAPQNAWKPVITDITGSGTQYTLTGTQINGISEGATYGDDNEMASNYPIVQLTDSSGVVTYVRSFNWSSTGVATGSTPETVQFTTPTNLAPGSYAVRVIANGIASDPFQMNFGPFGIKDISHLEGDIGLTDFVFTVTQLPSSNTVSVAFATADGTATAVAGNDYLPTSGTITFAPGETAKQITVEVIGNIVAEPNEAFYLQLFAANATNQVAVAIGTIINDDVDVSVGDVTVTEGNSGTTNAVFAITATGVVPNSVAVAWATDDDTANAGSDYLPESGVVSFPSGGGTAFVTVPIVGDTLNESTEDFHVDLSFPQGRSHSGRRSWHDSGQRPAADLYVNDVHATTQSGTMAAVFSVALNTPSGQTLSVQYSTADDTAHAGVDYTPESGTLSFAPGQTTQLVTVPILASSPGVPLEDFMLNLSNPVHAVLADSQGVGTITFGPAPPAEYIIDAALPAFRPPAASGPTSPTPWPISSTTTTTPRNRQRHGQLELHRTARSAPTRFTPTGFPSATGPPMSLLGLRWLDPGGHRRDQRATGSRRTPGRRHDLAVHRILHHFEQHAHGAAEQQRQWLRRGRRRPHRRQQCSGRQPADRALRRGPADRPIVGRTVDHQRHRLRQGRQYDQLGHRNLHDH